MTDRLLFCIRVITLPHTAFSRMHSLECSRHFSTDLAARPPCILVTAFVSAERVHFACTVSDFQVAQVESKTDPCRCRTTFLAARSNRCCSAAICCHRTSTTAASLFCIRFTMHPATRLNLDCEELRSAHAIRLLNKVEFSIRESTLRVTSLICLQSLTLSRHASKHWLNV